MFDRKEYMEKWRKDNAEHLKEYNRQYKKDNSENIKKRQRKWNKDNSEYLKEYRKQQYLKNRDKELKQAKLWKKKNPRKMKEINNRYYQKYREGSKKYKKNYLEKRRQNHKAKVQYIQDYKISKGCSICGYNENPRFLGFHHPDDNKEYNVSEAVTQNMSLKNIKEEMDKCILLCGSCHPKLHWKLKSEEKKKLDKNKKKV